MARRTKNITIAKPNRDQGKCFVLTEMPATQAEQWAVRAFLAIARADFKLSEELRGAGMAGIAAVALKSFAGMSWFDAQPLMDEMFACIKIMPNPQNTAIVRDLVESDIEEVQTRFDLRMEVLELHTGFSIAGYLSTFQWGGPAAEPQ